MSDPTKGRDERKRVGSGPEAPRDWTGVKARFVASDLSTREFAVAEGIPYSTIAKRAAAYGWDAAREQKRTRVAVGVVDKAVKHRIRSEAVIDGTAHRAAYRLSRTVDRLLRDADKALTIDDLPKLKTAAETLEKVHRLARLTAHLPAEPDVRVDGDDFSGELVIRRRAPDGSEVEVTVGGQAHRDRPDGPAPDADAVGVSTGLDDTD